MKKLYTILVLLTLVLSTPLFAQTPCSLDNSFHTNGTLITDGSRLCDRVLSLPNGQVLVVYNPFGNGHVYIRRLQNNGTVDNTYGSSGKLSIQVASATTTIKGTYLKQDTLYVCGSTGTGSNTYAFVAKVKPDGSLDASFGNGGISSYSNFYTFNQLIPEPNSDKLLIAGMKGVSTASITRFHASGYMDGNFGNLGSTNVNSSGTGVYYEIRDLKTDQNNNIVITGKYYTTQGSNIFTQLTVMRFTPSGALDNSFDSDGIAVYNSATNHHNEGVRIFVNSANDYYVTGAAYNGMDWDYSLLKIKNNGTPDATFGSSGWKIYDLSGHQEHEYHLNAVMLTNGNILMTGNQGSGDTVHFALLMVKPDGSFDQNFAPNGLFMNIFGTNNNNSSSGLSLTQDGKIYLSGYSRTCQNGTCGPLYGGVARYLGGNSNAGTATNQLTFDGLLKLYPNPIKATNYFQLDYSLHDALDVRVFNAFGQSVPFKKLDQHRYQLLQASAGMYWVEVRSKEKQQGFSLLVE